MVTMLREAENQRIDLNNGTITLLTYPTRVDKYNRTVADYGEDPVETEKTDVRISTESSSIEEKQRGNTPTAIIASKYLIAKYDNTWLVKGLKLTFEGKQYQTDVVQDNRRYDEIINKTCLLIDLTEVA